MNTLYMFPPDESPTEDLELLAGEYALGVMDSGEAAATRVRADTDYALLEAIGAWQGRLAPMTLMLCEVEPSPTLWSRLADEIGMPEPEPAYEPEPEPEPEPETLWIEPAAPETVSDDKHETMLRSDEPIEAVATVDPSLPDLPPAQRNEAERVEPFWAAKPNPTVHPNPDTIEWSEEPPLIEPPAPISPPVSTVAHIAAQIDRPVPPTAKVVDDSIRPRLRDRIVVWQVATAASLALTIVIAASALILSPSPLQAVAAIGVTNAPAPIYLAEMDRAGHLRITPLALIAVPNGRDLLLWMLPPNSDQPTSLGVLSPGGSTISLGSAAPEGTRLIVSMEPRGASSGRITGQVLYGGTLVNH